MSRYVRIGTVVKELGLSANSWRRYADAGLVQCSRVNGHRVFNLESCEAFLRTGNDLPARTKGDAARMTKEWLKGVRT